MQQLEKFAPLIARVFIGGFFLMAGLGKLADVQATVIWLKDDPALDPPLSCAPCYARECRFKHTRCLTEISPQRVLKALSI